MESNESSEANSTPTLEKLEYKESNERKDQIEKLDLFLNSFEDKDKVKVLQIFAYKIHLQ